MDTRGYRGYIGSGYLDIGRGVRMPMRRPMPMPRGRGRGMRRGGDMPRGFRGFRGGRRGGPVPPPEPVQSQFQTSYDQYNDIVD